jgi:hypothetical protein
MSTATRYKGTVQQNGSDPEALHIERVLVTPQIAEVWLSKNVENRIKREGWCLALAEDMEAGRYVENAETIKIAPDGTLVDGQHRLTALILSGASVWMWVAFNVPIEAQATVDTGKARTFSDTLGRRGAKNAVNLATVVRRMYFYERSGNPAQQHGEVSLARLLEFYERHPDMYGDLTKRGKSLYEANGHLLVSVADYAVLSHVLGAVATREDVEAFWEGISHRSSKTLTLLHNRLAEARKNQTSQKAKMPVKTRMALCIKAWNFWIEGEEVGSLSYRAGGANPEPFPVARGAAS